MPSHSTAYSFTSRPLSVALFCSSAFMALEELARSVVWSIKDLIPSPEPPPLTVISPPFFSMKASAHIFDTSSSVVEPPTVKVSLLNCLPPAPVWPLSFEDVSVAADLQPAREIDKSNTSIDNTGRNANIKALFVLLIFFIIYLPLFLPHVNVCESVSYTHLRAHE